MENKTKYIDTWFQAVKSEVEAMENSEVSDEDVYNFCNFLMDNATLPNAWDDFKEEARE